VVEGLSARRSCHSPPSPLLRSLSPRPGPPSGARGPGFGRPPGHRFTRFTLSGGRHGVRRTMAMVSGAVWPTSSAGCAQTRPVPTRPEHHALAASWTFSRPALKHLRLSLRRECCSEPDRLAEPQLRRSGLGASVRIRRTIWSSPSGVLAPPDRSSRSSGERPVTPSLRGQPKHRPRQVVTHPGCLQTPWW
jgi:hypothetical protein